ncbi:MAG: TetR/AcrR family transcriptional regulator [Pseudomonadota bacterium]
MPKSIARGQQTRAANMHARRERIYDAARRIIAVRGFDALNLRELAMAAGVTVPTIYNLIGNKSALVAQLFDETIAPFENLQYITSDNDPVASPAEFLDRVVDVMRDNENYYRAEFLARESLTNKGDAVALAIQERIVQIAVEACEQAKTAGLTTGDIAPKQLGTMIADHFLLAYRDWAHGKTSLEVFRDRVIAGAYICLAADATKTYRQRIVEMLNTSPSRNLVIPLKK